MGMVSHGASMRWILLCAARELTRPVQDGHSVAV
jgi:hypothetical protein